MISSIVKAKRKQAAVQNTRSTGGDGSDEGEKDRQRERPNNKSGGVDIYRRSQDQDRFIVYKDPKGRASSHLGNDEQGIQGNSANGVTMLGLAGFGYFQLSGLHCIQDPRAKPANPRPGGFSPTPECWRHTLLWWMSQHRHWRGVLELYGVANGVHTGALYGVHSAICPRRGSWNWRWISNGSTARWGSPLPA